MKFDLKKLFGWYLIFHFFIDGALRDFILKGSTDRFDFSYGFFVISALTIFFLSSLIAYWFLFRFYPNRYWLLIIMGILLAFIIPIGIRYLIEQYLYNIFFGTTNYPKEYGIKNYLIDNYSFMVRQITFGTIYYFVKYSMFKQENEKDLIMEKQKMEMSMLRSQINPHFLLNSLNNIYSLVFHKSENALNALDGLSDLLKYSLYEKRELVPLSDEVKNIDKFVELQKLRFDYPIYVQVKIDPGLSEVMIPQFTLLPLIENGFKHGVLKNVTYPLSLVVSEHSQSIEVNCTNEKSNAFKDSVGGVGLENLKKRLTLLYPSNHHFEIVEDDQTFTVSIKIPKR